MAISTEDLDSMLQLVSEYPNGSHAVIADKNNPTYGAWAFNGEKLLELIRLARLGLVIDATGMPSKEELRQALHAYDHRGEDISSEFVKVLAWLKTLAAE